jgi:hypothetical protein
MPAWQFIVRGHVTRDLRANHESDLAFSQFVEGHYAIAPVGFIRHPDFTIPNVRYGLSVVAVPLHCIHGKIKMGIDGEHIFFY